MREPWEKAHVDSSVSLSSFWRDGEVLLSGAVAGAAAVLVAGLAHVIAGLALRLGPLAFLHDLSDVLFPGTGPASPGQLVAASGVALVGGVGLGVVFALAADRLERRDSVLWLALGSGLGLGAIALAAVQVGHLDPRLPPWEILVNALVYGVSLVTQRAVLDVAEGPRPSSPPRPRDDQGPVRLPVLGRA